MTPNDIHINEWVFADIDGKRIPVKIGAVHDDQVTATNVEAGIYDVFNMHKLSPIKLTRENVRLFDFSKAKRLSVQQNKTTGNIFVRYIDEKKQLKKYYKLNYIHELQQYYYKKFKYPMELEILKTS